MELTEEQRMLVRSVRQMAMEKIAPRAREVDETEEYPWDWIELFRENGLYALTVPKEYGGLGGSYTTICLVIEELAKFDATAAMFIDFHALISAYIKFDGNEEQKKRYLPEIARGISTAISVTEPSGGSDVSALKTTAVLQGDHYLLNGAKVFASNSKVADLIITYAMVTSGEGPGGLTGFIIDKGTPGVIIGRVERKLGQHGLPACELFYENAPVPVKNRLGAEGEGFKTIWAGFNKGRIDIAALAIGIAEGAIDYATNYAKERVQFGRPIAAFQGIQFMLADMATQTEAARCLVYEAASMLDKGDKENATKFASMAKLFATDVAMKVTTDAVQILGGYGYTKEHPVERMMRDAKAMQIVEGTNQIQRMIIARYLVGRFD